ncbi:hypothetical protein [Kitasatospora sp. NPDC094011]|uniref:hypothetical protein n=1 Tax=Kitasatospora sp. NPDC094011 TaxID=3364090 RepID=UPI00382E0FFE
MADDEKKLSNDHDAAAGAHTGDARQRHAKGQSAHRSITNANNARKTASRLRRKGR